MTPQTVVTVEPRENRAIAPEPPEDPRPDVVWPLTGVDATEATEDQLAVPAIAIKVENSRNARPQTNLDRADIVFEQYVEGGISRLVAVYHSDIPDEVGPIRSMRPMDKNIVGSLSGPLVFSGAQRRFITDAQNSGQRLIAQDIGSPGFFRSTLRFAPHNLHGRMADFIDQASDMPPAPAQFAYAYPDDFATAAREGENITRIEVNMSRVAHPRWEWSATDQNWKRLEDTTPHVTSGGTQMWADNIIILWIDIRYTSRQGGSSVPETLVITKGSPGYVVSGDSYIEIEWSKANRTAPFVLRTVDGEIVELKPGKTWVELIPRSGVTKASVTFE